MWTQLVKTKEKVKHILENYESTRDCDMKLLSIFWLMESRGTDYDLKQFLKRLHTFTTAESITRCRRKIQEQFPHLRWKSYESRQTEFNFITEKIKEL